MDITRERFDAYRNWLQALKIGFLNLPIEFQERFLPIADRFAEDCRKLLDESRLVKEKKVRLIVDNAKLINDKVFIQGTIKETGHSVRISYPFVKETPRIQDELMVTLFSLDGETWYSSKEELITGH